MEAEPSAELSLYSLSLSREVSYCYIFKTLTILSFPIKSIFLLYLKLEESIKLFYWALIEIQYSLN
jgi:hypothetical protein